MKRFQSKGSRSGEQSVQSQLAQKHLKGCQTLTEKNKSQETKKKTRKQQGTKWTIKGREKGSVMRGKAKSKASVL